MIKYIVYPGHIITYGRDPHYISFRDLIRLYDVDPCECVNADNGEALRGLGGSVYVKLRPNRNGNYKLPA